METQDSHLHMKHNQTVLTVPMRNGNINDLGERFAEKGVLTVPMRNGNAKPVMH